MRKVAFFDVDGTIFRSSLLIELVEVLIENQVFDASLRYEYERKRIEWLDRKGDYESYIDSVIEVFMKNIKGVEYSKFDRAVKQVNNLYKNRVYRYTRDMVKDLKKKKYYLVAISQSPKAILDDFCLGLGFDKVYGRFYEIGPTNRLTGNIADLHLISNKANIVKRVVEKENLTLKGSIGVGDTENDFSFLEMVENPICFNPNSKLLRHAKRNGWRVVVERKDVIYEIM